MSVEQKELEATLDVQNIGGIDETSVVFEPGVTVLAGRNATNQTSLLQGIIAALGSDDVSIKNDADEAHVELEFDDSAGLSLRETATILDLLGVDRSHQAIW